MTNLLFLPRGRPGAVRDVLDAGELDRRVGGVRLPAEGHQRRLRGPLQGAGVQFNRHLRTALTSTLTHNKKTLPWAPIQ